MPRKDTKASKTVVLSGPQLQNHLRIHTNTNKNTKKEIKERFAHAGTHRSFAFAKDCFVGIFVLILKKVSTRVVSFTTSVLNTVIGPSAQREKRSDSRRRVRLRISAALGGIGAPPFTADDIALPPTVDGAKDLEALADLSEKHAQLLRGIDAAIHSLSVLVSLQYGLGPPILLPRVELSKTHGNHPPIANGTARMCLYRIMTLQASSLIRLMRHLEQRNTVSTVPQRDSDGIISFFSSLSPPPLLGVCYLKKMRHYIASLLSRLLSSAYFHPLSGMLPEIQDSIQIACEGTEYLNAVFDKSLLRLPRTIPTNGDIAMDRNGADRFSEFSSIAKEKTMPSTQLAFDRRNIDRIRVCIETAYAALWALEKATFGLPMHTASSDYDIGENDRSTDGKEDWLHLLLQALNETISHAHLLTKKCSSDVCRTNDENATSNQRTERTITNDNSIHFEWNQIQTDNHAVFNKPHRQSHPAIFSGTSITDAVPEKKKVPSRPNTRFPTPQERMSLRNELKKRLCEMELSVEEERIPKKMTEVEREADGFFSTEEKSSDFFMELSRAFKTTEVENGEYFQEETLGE